MRVEVTSGGANKSITSHIVYAEYAAGKFRLPGCKETGNITHSPQGAARILPRRVPYVTNDIPVTLG